MKYLKWPDVWLALGLLALTVGGARLLVRPSATDDEVRRLNYDRHPWQATFDALSATCGVGLLGYDFLEDYTDQGRWILSGLGVAGALLYVAAVTSALRRWRRSDAQNRIAHPALAVACYVLIGAVLIAGYVVAGWRSAEPHGLLERFWRALAAYASCGWASTPHDGLSAWPLALLAWLGSLGWMGWLLLAPPPARRWLQPRPVLAMVGGCAVVVLSAALLIALFETPRGTAGRDAPAEAGAPQGYWARARLALVQAGGTVGAGMPVVPLGERQASEATKLTLAALLVVGGLGGSATGGVQWPLIVWAALGALAALGCLGRPAPDVRRRMHAGLAAIVLLTALVVLVALGMLVLENMSASAYQRAPSLADALLDAASVTAGGNLTSGLVERITGRHLIVGIGHRANLYQYGMSWLMAAMFIGRLLPLMVMRWVGDGQGA